MAANEKEIAGIYAANLVEQGMVVGLGTGSTAFFAVRRLAERVREGLSVRGIPTSEQTRRQAEGEGIPLVGFDDVTSVDLTIDGADEIDGRLEMIKGGGGALLREKIVASASVRVVTVVNAAKCVPALGAFPLPVEVVPFGWRVVAPQLAALGCEPKLRRVKGGGHGDQFVTDNGNYILDCPFGRIDDPAALEQAINDIPGVVVCGLFVGLATTVVIGRGGDVEVRDRSS